MKTTLRLRLKKATSILIIVSFMAQSLTVFADTTADPAADAGHKPTVNEVNHVPVVDIAAPNASGLSHNLYTDFNVNANGLILNNAVQPVDTALAGNIQANANFQGTAASIILNEVTGTNRTNLNGMLEVAGSRAAVIIANPNGITGDSFGFINTSRASLVTGTPNIDENGNLSSFNVNRGDVAIQGQGLSQDTPATKLDILTRAAQINAKVWADEINVITGNNKIDYQTLQIAGDTQATGPKPEIALDVGAVGGMYAGKIKLIGTEKGLGVYVRGDINGEKEVTLTNAGKIILDQNEDEENDQGSIFAKEDLVITAADDIINNGELVSEKNTTVSAKNIENHGYIVAGESPQNAEDDEDEEGAGQPSIPGAAANLAITASGKLTNNGSLSATQDVVLSGNEVNYEKEDITAERLIVNGQEIDLSAAPPEPGGQPGQNPAGPSDKVKQPSSPGVPEIRSSSTPVEKESDLPITADQSAPVGYRPIIDKTASGIRLVQIASPSAGGVSRNIYLDFNINPDGLILNNATQYTKTQLGGYIDKNYRLNGLGAKVILNEVSGGNVSKLNGFLEVAGQQAGVVIANPNGIFANGFGYINTSQATLSTLDGFVWVQGDGINAAAANHLMINANQFLNSSSELWAKKLSIATIGYLTNNGRIITTDNLSISGSGLYNQANSLIDSAGDIAVDVRGKVDNQAGIIKSDKDITITAPTVENSEGGALSSSKSTNIHSDLLINKGSTLSSEGDYHIQAKSISNEDDAALFAKGNLTLGTEEQIVNDDSVIAAGGTADIKSNDIKNIDNSILYSSGNMTLQAANNVVNQSSEIQSQNNIDITARKLTNEKADFKTDWDVAHKNISYPIPHLNQKRYYKATRRFDREIKTGQIKEETAAAQIVADKDITINADEVSNRYSTLAAGKDMTITAGSIENSGYQGTVITTDKGTDTHYWKYKKKRKLRRSKWKRGSTSLPYYDWSEVDTDTSRLGIISAGDKVTLNAGTIENETYNAGGDAIGHRTKQVSLEITDQMTANGINSAINSKIFSIHTDPAAKYLIETDGRFADYQNFLSSDYLLERVKTDPEKILKRLGDGYYEQKLVTEQIAELTGRKLLDKNYGSDLEQFKALMGNGGTVAQEYNLTVGVALTKEQMAALTSDMVWLVEKVVNGEKVLVPQVYLSALREGDITSGGAVIAGNDVEIIAQDSLKNIGTIKAGHTLAARAENISNINGKLQADDINLTAQDTIANRSGLISGGDISLDAGNIVNQSQTSTIRYKELEQTKLNDTAGIVADKNVRINARDTIKNQGAVLSAGQELNLSAGNEIDLESVSQEKRVAVAYRKSSASLYDKTYAGSRVTGQKITVKSDSVAVKGTAIKAADSVKIDAEHGVKLTAEKNLSESDITVGKRGGTYFGRRQENHESVAGSSIEAGGSIDIRGTDIQIKGSNVASEAGTIRLEAKDNVSVSSETERHESLLEEEKKESGLLSTKRTKIYDYKAREEVAGSNISGKEVDIRAKQGISVSGSNIVADQDVMLTADKNIDIAAAEQTSQSEYKKSVKKSGVFSGGGLGFTIGSQKQKRTNTQDSISQVGSVVGSTGGKVTIGAGQDVSITASDTISGKDTTITGQNVTIEAADNTDKERETYEFKQSGLSVALGGQAIDNIQGVYQPAKRASEVEDSRLKALYDYKAVKAADNLSRGKNADGSTKKDGGLSVSISLGTSKKRSETNAEAATATPSQVTAGGDVSITATGEKDAAGNHIGGGDLNITGSAIDGQNIHLSAANDVNLTAAENTTSTKTTSSGKSAGIGVNVSAGQAPGFFVEGSKSSGRENGNTATHTNTQVTAADTVTIESGQDTNLKGAQVKGKTVDVDAKGDLNLESLQDIDNYKETNKSAGGTVNFGAGGLSGTASASKGHIDSEYKSVTEQTGIYAGEGGFDITVGGNTDLKGAVISSEATPDKNKLSTDTLTYSDIENHADYSASSVGVNLDTRKNEKYNEQGLTPNIGTPASGDSSSTTKAAVSNGTIDIRSNPNQDISSLSRDTTNALNSLGKIFDKETIKEKQELASLFGEIAFEEIHKLSDKNGWGDGSPEKVALHSLIGGIMSELTGSGFTSGAIGAGVNELVQKELEKQFKDHPDMWQWASYIIGTAAAKVVDGDGQAGGSTAVSGTKYNDQGFGKPIKLNDPQLLSTIVIAGIAFNVTKAVDGTVSLVGEAGKNIATWSEEAGKWIGTTETTAINQQYIDTLNNYIQQAHIQISKTEVTIQSANDIIRDTKQVIADTRQQIADLQIQIASDTAETAELQEKIIQLQTDINERQKIIEGLENDITILQTKKSELLKQLYPPGTDTSYGQGTTTTVFPNNGGQTTATTVPPIQSNSPDSTIPPITSNNDNKNGTILDNPANNPTTGTGVITASWQKTSDELTQKGIDVASWNQGSFGSTQDSVAYHYNTHGAEVGAENVEQYIRKAEAFKQNLRGAKTFPVDGAVAGVTRYVKNGRYIDLASDGTIVSFGKR
ncbi:hypothetical protein P22_0367 [Propionispora sp. 2/2-37]|uniref:two-partner secretion domain-containing protein n=1 Tax=Propionispora sp. 2/2-37 TaxID=1677858 RepID=UPI0006BB6629|nr:hemagglutinin repeat-containing protein [Propionispora sp. 2/2-37]CUH94301.1 hypothetical protein P22_0367 [Propionispora sp. 2/2-37]